MPRCILVLFLLLAACATEEEIRAAVVDPYMGLPFDNFVIARGPPEETFVLEDGGKIYTWSSGKETIKGTKTVTVSDPDDPDDPDGKEIEIPDNREVECRLKIHADKTGIVESIEITLDPSGYWYDSWCYEKFK